MHSPDHQVKSAFFKTLTHPARIRVLELLSHREYSVAEMLPDVGIEKTNLSLQLAVLRRAALVTARREGSTVYSSLTSPHVAELLDIARRILSGRSVCSMTCATRRTRASRPRERAGDEPRPPRPNPASVTRAGRSHQCR